MYVPGVRRSFNILHATVIPSCLLVCLMTSAMCMAVVAVLILKDRDIPMLWFIFTCLPGRSSVFQAKMVNFCLKSASETPCEAFCAFRKATSNRALYAIVESHVSLKSHSISLSVWTPSSLRLAWVMFRFAKCVFVQFHYEQSTLVYKNHQDLVGFLVTRQCDREGCWSWTQSVLRTLKLVMLIFVLSVPIPAFTGCSTGSSCCSSSDYNYNNKYIMLRLFWFNIMGVLFIGMCTQLQSKCS